MGAPARWSGIDVADSFGGGDRSEARVLTAPLRMAALRRPFWQVVVSYVDD
jgi:hypothetical protein